MQALIHTNQGLLSALDVSHSKLDLICKIARDHAFAGKLTGAGGGGYAYVLLQPDIEDARITVLSHLLESADCSVVRTKLGYNGVTIDYA